MFVIFTSSAWCSNQKTLQWTLTYDNSYSLWGIPTVALLHYVTSNFKLTQDLVRFWSCGMWWGMGLPLASYSSCLPCPPVCRAHSFGPYEDGSSKASQTHWSLNAFYMASHPKDRNLHQHCCENLTSHRILLECSLHKGDVWGSHGIKCEECSLLDWNIVQCGK